MAYVPEANDPNAPANTGAPAPTGPMNQLPATSSGTGAGATQTNTSTSGSPQGAPAVPNSSQAAPVQDLGAYLAANQPQALQMGQNIANNLTTGYNQVTGDINADQAAFDQSVQASNVIPNSDLVSRAAADPTQFVTNPDDITAFQQQMNAAYTGPTSFESSTYDPTLTQEVTNAQQNAPDITKPGGIEQLVAGQETNPTLGMTNLDALLLQENPDAVSPISSAIAPYANLGTTLADTATTENNNIAEAQANDTVAPQLVYQDFMAGPNATVPAWEQALQAELAQAQQGTNNYNLGVQNDIAMENGLQPSLAQYEATLGNTPFGYTAPTYNAITNAPTEQNVATQQDYATEAALEQLLGANLGSTPINQSTASQAGTFSLPTEQPLTPTELAQNYGKAIAATKPTYSSSEQSLLQYLNSIDPENFPYAAPSSGPGWTGSGGYGISI